MIKELKEWGSKNIKPKDGHFPERPADAKSLTKWLAEGKVPVNYMNITYYAMSNGTQGYGYYRENEVRDMTAEEKAEATSVEVNKQNNGQKAMTSLLPSSQGNPRGQNWVYQNMDRFTGKTIVALDTETTGFYNSDELLQLSIVGPKGDTKFNSYLKPHHKFAWPQAMKINHITPAMVANAPYPEAVREEVQKILDAADYIIGFNVNFDIRMLRNNMKLNIPDEKVVDIMKIFKQDEPGLDHYRLADGVELYASEKIKEEYCSGAHDSLTDTVATMHMFVQQYKLHINGEKQYDQQKIK